MENEEVVTENTVVFGGFGKRTEKTKENKHGWEDCSFEKNEINPKKRTVLYFGGNGTISPGHANFGCKLIESLVGSAKENNFDLFGFFYTHNQIVKKFFDKTSKQPILDKNGMAKETFDFKNSKMTETDLAKVYNAFLRPLFVQKNGKVFEQNQIEKNLSNLSIFAYCMGSQETNKLLSEAHSFLSQKFDEKTATNLLSNVFVVHFAPCEEPKFGTNVEFKSLQDVVTKEPWIASKNGWGFNVQEPFLGVAQTSLNKNKNGIEVFSNSFVSVEDMLKQNPSDPHSLSNFLKIEGVIDRSALPSFEKEDEKTKQKILQDRKNGKTSKRPAGYSRQQAIADLLGTTLGYGLVAPKRNLSDIELILNAQIKNENKVVFEKEQKTLFEKAGQTQTNNFN